jgi:hypothetical protein
METKYLFTILMIITEISIIWSECPKPELLTPCECASDVISCGGTENINLKDIFNSLSKKLTEERKHFKKFYLNNKAITEIEENIFNDLTFDEIWITEAFNLTLINTNAFNETNFITKRFYVNKTPIINNPPKYDIFNSVSKMKNLEKLTINETNITEFPSYAFKPINGYQNKLISITIGGSNTKTVNNNTFYNLNSLQYIDIYLSPIHNISIPSEAFNFRSESNETISIILDSFLFNGTIIDPNCLQNIKRPVELYYVCGFVHAAKCQITYLEKNVFLTFLNSNPKNKIMPYTISAQTLNIDCDNCRSYWITKNTAPIDRIEGLNCNNGKRFEDSTNFAKCA